MSHDVARKRRASTRSHISTTSSAQHLEDTDADLSPDSGSYHDTHQARRPASAVSYGKLSYAPTTQTTVVTTTTTTTTAFQPIVVKPPRLLRYANQEHYPLAASPTPPSIQRIRFKLGGQDTFFEEAEDAETRTEEIKERQPRSKADQYLAQSTKPETPSLPPRSRTLPRSTLREAIEQHHHEVHETDRNRSATPISLPDAAELHSFHRRNTRPRPAGPSQLQHSLIEDGSTPSEQSDDDFRSRQMSVAESSLQRRLSAPAGDSPDIVDAEDTTNADEAESRNADQSSLEPDSFSNFRIPEPKRRSVAPSNINTSPLHDASLPSPSLSPITAAANLRDETARRAQLWGRADVESPLALARQTSMLPSPGGPDQEAEEEVDTRHPLMDVPAMIDTFDSMPDQLKTYMVYQMLRRCSKRTLLFVSDVIDPALRCDFLARLPLELCLNITSRLDAKSLCRAAQVSKKWRSIIDSDERTWKNLIELDGFVLPEGEIERAVREGWGWQMPAGRNDADRDLTQSDMLYDVSPAEELSRRLSEGSARGSRESPAVAHGRRKRKSSIMLDKSGKRQRRARGTAGHLRSAEWLDSLEEASGPVAHANAACLAMPDPGIGLPSLRRLSLFKAIYRRHCCIMKGWMDVDFEPLHLAFRAHQRHVVTCLQFDSEKILTGSDDASIDIYDTNNGASLRTLRGHDGGVWALEYHGDILVSGSTDRTVRVWNMKSGKLLHIFYGHTSTVRCLQILQPSKVGETADGKPIMMPQQPLIITGSRDSTCRIWTLPEPEDRSHSGTIAEQDNTFFVRALTGHSNSVRAIAAHADTLVSGSYDSTVRVWRISDGECVYRLQGHTSKVYSVVLDNARNRCISGSMDSLVKVWSLETGTCLFNLEGHTSLVGLLDLKDDCLVSAAADTTLRIWEPEQGRCQHTLRAHTAAITCFAHDKQKIISGSDRTLKMWNTETGECVRDLLTDLGGVWQIKFDQRRCVAAVQRKRWTYIEVLDFGAARDGWAKGLRGRRIVVDHRGKQIHGDEEPGPDNDPAEAVEIAEEGAVAEV